MARGSIALLGMWPGWGPGGMTPEQAVRSIKAPNPNVLVFNYINNNEIDSTATATYGDVLNALQTKGWLLYSNGGSGNAVKSIWGSGNFLEINNTLFAPTDSNGDRYIEWYAKWAVSKFANPIPSLDGFYMDNVFWAPRVNGDWNRDGVTDSSSDPTVQSWYRQGYRRHFQYMNQLQPGRYQLGNVADWGAADSLAEYQGILNGGEMEGIIGWDVSTESWGGWSEMMKQYRKTMATFAEPKLGIFQQIGEASDYQGFRYGLSSCLMDDGYFAYTSAAHPAAWFDEYGVNLGYATSSPPTASWQSGVYRRDFQNGIALVNPKGNGARQVFLEDDYVKISGTQDPSVNNGQTVRSVILRDRDGIILVRKNASTSPIVTSTPTTVSSSSTSTPVQVISSSSASSSSSRAATTPTTNTGNKKVPAPPSAVSVR